MQHSQTHLIDLSDYNPALRLYWQSAVFAGLAVIALSLYGVARFDRSQQLMVLALMGLAASTSLIPTRVPGTQVFVSPGDVFVFVAALFYGPAGATLTAVSEAFCASYSNSKKWTSRIGGPSYMAVAIYVSATFLTLALSGLKRQGWLTDVTLIVVLLLFSSIHFFLNTILVAAHHALRHKERLLSHWRKSYSWTGYSYLAGGATAGFVYFAVQRRSPAVLICVAPLIAVTYAMSRYYFRQAEERVKANDRINLIVSNTANVIFAFDLDGGITYINPAIKAIAEYTVEEAMSLRFLSLVSPDDRARLEAIWEKLAAGESCIDEEFRIQTKRGKTKWCSGSWGPLLDERGSQIGVQGHLQDISERVALESQLAHSQKMEAIGRLAGGIAHDFNNLLSVMAGYSQLAIAELDEPSRARQYVEHYLKTTYRATALTKQLLAFARRQPLQPVMLEINDLVRELIELVGRLLGPGIRLVSMLCEEQATVRADRGQIEQLIINLAVNARDAMPSGGTLVIQTGVVSVSDVGRRPELELANGEYVSLSVSDTGCGMDEETVSRIFEPFFTTKEKGKGTGLGLSMVYGIVKQSSGQIIVQSEVGKGATFKIYLPRVSAPFQREAEAFSQQALPNGVESILVVDDDDGPRKLAATVLVNAGYNVIEASSGEMALRICREHPGRIHLMLTDMGMPKMNGLELAKQAVAIKPALKVMLISGDSEPLAPASVSSGEIRFLQKPFSIDLLSRTVRDVLDQADGNGQAPDASGVLENNQGIKGVEGNLVN